MSRTLYMVLWVRLALALLLIPLGAPIAHAGVLATSGFNDATGIHSDPFLGSPYVVDVTVHNQGIGEPGWDGPWQRLGGFNDRAHVISEYHYEGDQAVTLWADRVFGTSIERAWSTLVPRVRVDAYVMARPAARMSGQLVRTCCGEIPGRTVAGWEINDDGSISVFDRSLDAYVTTPFSILPYEWNKYSLLADTRTKTWGFFFNDTKFHRAKPLKFVTESSFIDGINLSALDTRVTYVDYVTLTAIDPTTGDVNGDGVLNAMDIDDITLAVRAGANDPGYDVDGDKKVNSVDRTKWVNSKKNTYFGDTDLDGKFDSSDFVRSFQAGLYEDAFALNAAWSSGDWNGDGDFTSDDFVLAFGDGGYEKGPRMSATVAVPEPGTLSPLLALIAMIAVSCRARKRRD